MPFKKFYLTFLLISLKFFFTFSSNICEFNPLDFKQDPTVLSTLNGRIRGECNKIEVNDPQNRNYTGYVFSWKSVPYAEAPTNQNRFQKPKPVVSWSDIRNGTIWPKKCMQNSMIQNDPNISEDCLYLNIFVPAESYLKYLSSKNNKLPIVIFIHGGRFILGSSSDNSLDPSIFTSMSNVIFVTINYRLGPFGFMHMANSKISGNQGFLDQHMALKWVFENSDKFGGDSKKITLAGQSAGSFSVSYHLAYKPSWPYFRSAILQSGTLFYSTMELFPSDELTRRSKSVFNSSGCNYDIIKNDDFLTCVQNLSSQTILRANDNYEKQVLLGGKNLASELNPIFQLVLDGTEFNETIKNILKRKDIKKANILAGFTSHEAAFLIGRSGVFGSSPADLERNINADLNTTRNYLTEFYTYFPRYPSKPDVNFLEKILANYTQNLRNESNYFKTLIQILSEEIFICPSISLAQMISQTNKVYLYSFEKVKPNGFYPKAYGSVHSDDIDYVFGQTMSIKIQQTPFGQNNPELQYTEEDREFSKKLIIYWSNFIKTNSPNIGIKTNNSYWPLFYHQPNNSSFFGLIYGLFNHIINFLSEMFTNPIKFLQNVEYDQYLILDGNNTRVGKEFLFENKFPRHCNFWKAYENY